ncbi:hypothetical protein D3C75_804970 [compost metagenome]
MYCLPIWEPLNGTPFKEKLKPLSVSLLKFARTSTPAITRRSANAVAVGLPAIAVSIRAASAKRSGVSPVRSNLPTSPAFGLARSGMTMRPSTIDGPLVRASP